MVSKKFLGGRPSFFEAQESQPLTSEVEEAYNTMNGLNNLLDKLDRLIAMRQNSSSNDADYNKEAHLILSQCIRKINQSVRTIEEKKIATSEVDLSEKTPPNQENAPTHSNDGSFKIR